MNKKFIKCNIPIIWLDTSIIFKMALWKLNLSLSDVDKRRVSTLYNLISKLLERKKILCPAGGGQEEEIWVSEKTCQDIIHYLSYGVDFKHRQAIEDLLVTRFMKAFINKEQEIVLSYQDVFYKDPIRELQSDKPFIIYVNTARLQTIEQVKLGKDKICKSFELIRQEAQNNKETFEERLQNEYTGYMKGQMQLGANLWLKISTGQQPTFEDVLGSMTLGMHLNCWKNYGGNPGGLPGLVGFYNSDIFKKIPCIDISCKLLTKIIVSNASIESGDSMDTQLISAYLPFCNIMITDRKMKNRIKELKLDKEYETDVYALDDYDKIEQYLSRL